MFKLGHYTNGDWVEHSHPPIYAINATDGPSSTILTTAPGSDPTVFERLATCMAPPYYLLYVLHTPRGEEEAGRYQSPAISEAEFASFIQKFEQFLKNDGRFDIWLHSQIDQATVVWDSHNLIHIYGDSKEFLATLHALGFEPGEPAVPVPHSHRYHSAFDDDAQAVLASFEWIHSPLAPDDEQ